MSKELKRPDDDKVDRQDARIRARMQTDEERQERERQQRTDPLYLEKTRPEDPSSRAGQLTRDNVNPSIPSGERGAPTNAGGIVDPTSLGMPQGGKEPTAPMQPEHPTDASPEEQKRWQEERAEELNQQPREGEILGSPHSINEPPGSDVTPPIDEGTPVKKPAGDVKEVEMRDLSDPDEMEEELDEEEDDDDDDKPTRRTSTSKTLKKKK